jgi:hypothetical protein
MSQSKISITREKNKDLGFVILLCLLVCYFRWGTVLFLQLSVVCILVSLVIPGALKPVSFVWYRLSEVLGTIFSRMLLFTIFFCIITPIGVAHRMISKKRLLTEQWKKNRESVFKDRNVRFTFSDLKNPF